MPDWSTLEAPPATEGTGPGAKIPAPVQRDGKASQASKKSHSPTDEFSYRPPSIGSSKSGIIGPGIIESKKEPSEPPAYRSTENG